MKLEILYEDNHLIVVLKPAGILSQEDYTKDPDMLTLLKQYIKEKYNKPGNVYLGLVMRLDRMTSGIMVFAKTSKAASRLSEQIKNMLKDNTVSNPDCKMILINALAIDMEWADSFSEEDTHGRPFYLENGEEVKATMMNQKNESEDVSYYVDNNITALSMNLEE